MNPFLNPFAKRRWKRIIIRLNEYSSYVIDSFFSIVFSGVLYLENGTLNIFMNDRKKYSISSISAYDALEPTDSTDVPSLSDDFPKM
jgi:hypothetical protein